MKDFKTVNKIDAHLHFNRINEQVIFKTRENNFSLITVNVDFPQFGTLEEQFSVSLELRQRKETRVGFIASFTMNNWQRSGWTEQTLAFIRQALNQGAIGVKIWKNIGMMILDERKQLLAIDDPRLDPIFTFLEKQRIPLLMHQAEPRNCWRPLPEINIKYDRDFFRMHPEQHMYLHPEKPGYEALLAARNRRLNKHPELTTIQAHLGSMEWDVAEVARFLDTFPKAFVDTAARINHLMYQAKTDRTKVRDFFIKYQDRILYGSDFFISDSVNVDMAQKLEQQWQSEWRFLSGTAQMRSDEFDGLFRGLGLPDTVIDKIYFKNALRAFPRFAETIPNEEYLISGSS